MLNKKKLHVFWITPESFLDVDMPVIEQLKSKFNIYWLIIGFNRTAKNMFTKTEVENFAKQNKIEYEIVTQKYRFRNPLILLFYFSLINLINKFKTELVYTSYLGEPVFLSLLKVFFKKSKVVVAIHDVELHSSEKKKWIKDLYHNHSRRQYSNFHLFSESQAEIFRKTVPGKNILITPLCIKDFGKPSPQCVRVKNQFLFFGSIHPYKGLEILIEAVNHLVHTYKLDNFSIIIAGNCSDAEWSKYKTKIVYPELFRTEIRVIKNIEIADLFCSSDYLILPYKDVTQCGPLMIAFNYTLPVIASDLQGFRDYISEGETGFLFKSNDHKKLAEIMADCINTNKHDLLAGNMMCMANAKFSPAVISEQYSEYFENLFICN